METISIKTALKHIQWAEVKGFLLALAVVAFILFCAWLCYNYFFRDLDCLKDFGSQTEAQRVLEQDLTDPNGLDANHDGIACNALL